MSLTAFSYFMDDCSFFACGHLPAQREQSPPQEKSSFFLRMRRTANITSSRMTRRTMTVAAFIHITPSASPISRTSSAATHAMAHWKITTPTAHLPPSSRRMEDTAATHGV